MWPLARQWLNSSGGGNSLSGLLGCRIQPLLLSVTPSTVLSVWLSANTWQPGSELTLEKTVDIIRQSALISTVCENPGAVSLRTCHGDTQHGAASSSPLTSPGLLTLTQ